jgi:glycosyltransferase involved in cell wall biosynthesis
MIQVAHVITRLDVGGSTENTVISATRMPRPEFVCTLLSGRTESPPENLHDTLAKANVRQFSIPRLQRSVSPSRDALALFELRSLLREIRPEIVHTHSSKAGFLGRLAAKLAGVRRIVHTPHGHVFHGYFSPATTQVFTRLERLAARWTDRIVTLSDAEAGQHLANGIGRAGQFVTIPSGVDLGQVIAASPKRLVAHGPIIGCVARLAPIKGQRYLIEAAPEILRSFPEATIALVGKGETRPALQAQAAALGVADRVVFAGHRDDVASVMSGFDMFVLPSLNEGMGRVLVMAMALGKAIVASAVGGIPELLDSGQAGLLVPPMDAPALAQAIVRLLREPLMAKELGEAGRLRARRYSAEAMIQSLAALYRDLMASR